MDLYIQTIDGAVVGHPALAENLIAAFGAIPENWEPFVRVPNPLLADKTIVLERPEPEYQKVNGIWQDVWFTRPKTQEELAVEETNRQSVFSALKTEWAERPYASNFSAWIFNETTLKHEPPIPRPTDGKFYRWSGPDNNWKEAEPFPQDGKKYYFDFDNWVNVEITDV